MSIEGDEKKKNGSAYNDNKYIFICNVLIWWLVRFAVVVISSHFFVFLKLFIPSDFVGGNELEIFVPVYLARRLRRLARVTLAWRGLWENVKFSARLNAFVTVLQHELGENLAGVYAHRMVRFLEWEPPVRHLRNK